MLVYKMDFMVLFNQKLDGTKPDTEYKARMEYWWKFQIIVLNCVMISSLFHNCCQLCQAGHGIKHG